MPLPKLNVLVPQEGYSVRDGDEVLMARVAGGPSRFRLDHIGAPQEIDVTLVLDVDEYAYWRIFWRGAIRRGSMPFLIDLVGEDSIIEEYRAQIIPGSMRLSAIQGTAHIVQMALEARPIIERTLAFDQAYFALLDLYGEGSQALLDALAQLMNTTMPESLA